MDPSSNSAPAPAPSELVVVMDPSVGLRASSGRFEGKATESVKSLSLLLAAHGARLRPMFGPTEERVLSDTPQSPPDNPALRADAYYMVDAPEDVKEVLRERLVASAYVQGAYIKPGVEPPAYRDSTMLMGPAAPTLASSDFSAMQGYLKPAPEGIDAHFAWTMSGGSGEQVKIVDVEGAWRFTHEDLGANQGGVLAGTETTDRGWRNHGTAVIGTFSADHNGVGVMGICSEATVSAVSVFGNNWGSAAAITAAASRLRRGDVMLIELHRPGPRYGFAPRQDQLGYIAVEWWPDDFLAIQRAVSSGVIVVEAGGNGAENLDDAIYDVAVAGFPASWRNPYRRNPLDSGAIVVGAGAPPPGYAGDHGPARSRLDFSNFGALFDAQGWGRSVTTTGYGDLQGGSIEDLWYTKSFSGTSSASPIVVGALGCLQGIVIAMGKPRLTPAEARALLRSTGSPQVDGPDGPATQRIGNLPDLRQLVARI